MVNANEPANKNTDFNSFFIYVPSWVLGFAATLAPLARPAGEQIKDEVLRQD